MKRILILLLLIITSFTIYSQNYKYAWLTDTHIGSPGAEEDLSILIKDINNLDDISFTVITGDITEKGKNDELDKSKELFDALKQPYYVIPGNHDTKWSESGGIRFFELWNSDRFFFNIDNDWHAGLNSGIILRGGGGHIIPEDLNWLEDTLKAVQPERLFLYVHHALTEDTDNWYKLINVVRNHNTVIVFAGHGHLNKEMNISGIPSVMGRSTLKGKGKQGYNIVEVRIDSLIITENIPGEKYSHWFAKPLYPYEVTEVDSVQLEYYSPANAVLKDFRVTVSAPLVAEDGRIFISSYYNGIFCVDYNGNDLWDYNPKGTIISRPAFHEGILVSATAEGDLFSLEAHTGKLIQIIGLGEAVTSQLEIIDIRYDEQMTKGILVGTGNGNLYCYDLYTFELIWENNSASGMIETNPLVMNNNIIYGAWDGYLYCLNAASGALIWKWSENKNFYYSPAAVSPVSDGRLVFITTPDKYTSAIDFLLGTTVWKKKNYEAWETIQISSNNEYLYIKGIEGTFYIVNSKDGSLKKGIQIGYDLDTTPSPPIETGEKIFFGSKNGMIYSINTDTFEWRKEFFLGSARIHSIIKAGENKIAAINMDGKLLITDLE